MLLSIIIPTYNSAGTIGRLLNTLLGQTFKDYEVIVIDDCSSDNTVDLVESISTSADIPIHLIQKEKNSGPGASRNIGVKQANGKYLGFIDSDDMVSDDYLASISDAIDRTKADLLYMGIDLVVGDKHNPRINILQDIAPSIAKVAGSLWRMIWRADLWKGVEMPQIKNAEDIAVIPVLIARANTIITIPKVLYYYIYTQGSLSGTRNNNVFTNFLESFNYTIKHFPRKKYTAELEFHGIKTILYGATLNGFLARVSVEDIRDAIEKFEDNFPNWWNNTYLNQYPKRKRLFLAFVKHRQFLILRIYAKLQEFVLRILNS